VVSPFLTESEALDIVRRVEKELGREVDVLIGNPLRDEMDLAYIDSGCRGIERVAKLRIGNTKIDIFCINPRIGLMTRVSGGKPSYQPFGFVLAMNSVPLSEKGRELLDRIREELVERFSTVELASFYAELAKRFLDSGLETPEGIVKGLEQYLEEIPEGRKKILAPMYRVGCELLQKSRILAEGTYPFPQSIEDLIKMNASEFCERVVKAYRSDLATQIRELLEDLPPMLNELDRVQRRIGERIGGKEIERIISGIYSESSW